MKYDKRYYENGNVRIKFNYKINGSVKSVEHYSPEGDLSKINFYNKKSELIRVENYNNNKLYLTEYYLKINIFKKIRIKIMLSI